MHILWISDSPDTPSGFGNVTRFVCGGLARRGYRVSILGWQAKAPYDWDGCRVHPPGSDPLGGDALHYFLIRERPDAVVALGDVWWLPQFAAPHLRRQMELTDTPWVLYFPIDGDTAGEGLPPSWVQLLREVDVPVAMSRYGQRIVGRHGISCEYIPHGVDLDVFSPPPDREAAKAKIGAQGRFVVLSDSRNQPRKLLPRLLDVFAKFSARRSDALLHLHTDPDDEFTRSGIYAYDVRADVRHLGLESQVRFTPGLRTVAGGGLSLRDLAAYYQASDVHLLASSGEGFGLPTLQAAAAGVVPMACAYSASRELVEGHGEAIDVEDWTENEFGIRRALIDVEDAARRLGRYYDDRALLRERSVLSRQFATAYGWDGVVDKWDALLRSVSGRRSRVRPAAARTAPIETLLPQFGPQLPGARVSVKVVERQFGRLEASILADLRGRSSEVQIPALPPPCDVARVRVPRQPGYVGVAGPDRSVLDALAAIFPSITGWTPGPPAEGVRAGASGLRVVPAERPEECRLVLAQSVLLLNTGGGFSAASLIDAALYGVPCIGTDACAPQAILWPGLTTRDGTTALQLARALLTDAARLRRAAAYARAACRKRYAPSEEDAAAWLRRLHAAREREAAPAGG